MPINHTSRTGDRVESYTDVIVSRIAALTLDERLTNLRLRDPNSSKNMVSLPWEDAE